MPIEPIQGMGAAEAEAVGKPQRTSETAHSRAVVNRPPKTSEDPAPAAAQDEVQRVVDGQRIVYKFVDKETNQVILQVPSEQVLSVMRGIEETLQASEKKLDRTS
jgi:hypothetical protein